MDANPLGEIEPIRTPKNKMVDLQLIVYGFFFVAFKILKAKRKILAV